MVTIDEVAAMASALPDVTEGVRWGNRTWLVNGNGFAWERPLSKADIKRLGDTTPPDGPIVAVRVADLGEREAVLATNLPGFFTIEHFSGYPAFLIQLKKATKKATREAILDAWLACAPTKVAEAYLTR